MLRATLVAAIVAMPCLCAAQSAEPSASPSPSSEPVASSSPPPPVEAAAPSPAPPATSVPTVDESEVVPTSTGASPPHSLWDGFSFGSYGRVVAASDLAGGLGRQANIVAHGTRIDEDTYVELELHRDDDFGPVHTRVVATLAVVGPLFAQSGDFTATLAMRNLYVEERGAFSPNLALWVGERMYRGDDIYLLNWWPLDNLNTVGGGARYDIGNVATVALHVGLNRLDSSYQYQTIQSAPSYGIGAVTVVQLDRPRTIASLKATWWLNGRSARAGIKLSAYAEAHYISSGFEQDPMNPNGPAVALPSDSGFVLGGQVGLYTGVRNTFANLFFRYGQGLGAYGDLSVPLTLTPSVTSARARDVVLAASFNWERGPFGVLGGAYIRYFRDADASVYSRSEYYEGSVVVRPTLWFARWAGISVEGSYQAVVYDMLDPITGVGNLTASEWRFGIIPFVTPAGRGNFTRPHLRVIYAITLRDSGAMRLYPPSDAYASTPVTHFLGIGCEWWFNSSYM